jgi:hypothetical protein
MNKENKSKPAIVVDFELARQHLDVRPRNAREAELLFCFRELPSDRQRDFMLLVEALYERYRQGNSK